MSYSKNAPISDKKHLPMEQLHRDLPILVHFTLPPLASDDDDAMMTSKSTYDILPEMRDPFISHLMQTYMCSQNTRITRSSNGTRNSTKLTWKWLVLFMFVTKPVAAMKSTILPHPRPKFLSLVDRWLKVLSHTPRPEFMDEMWALHINVRSLEVPSKIKKKAENDKIIFKCMYM